MREGDITSVRLWLRPLDEAVLDLLIEGQVAEAQAALGATISLVWARENLELFTLRRDGLTDHVYRPWGLRALVLRDTGAVIGHAGFHTVPGPDYLTPYATDAVEIGYEIQPDHRGRGLATETLNSLMAFARERGVRRFVMSIAPDNFPSLAMANRAGFTRVGEHHDEIDGLEEVWLRAET